MKQNVFRSNVHEKEDGKIQTCTNGEYTPSRISESNNLQTDMSCTFPQTPKQVQIHFLEIDKPKWLLKAYENTNSNITSTIRI